MSDLLRVIDALDTVAAGKGDTDIRSELHELIEEAAKRRAKLEEQLGMADEFLALLSTQ